MRPLWRTLVITESPVSSGFLAPQPGTREITPIDNEVVELALLLPRWQAEALEDAAHTTNTADKRSLLYRPLAIKRVDYNRQPECYPSNLTLGSCEKSASQRVG